MGIGNSKIPSPPPGQTLKFIGVTDLDKIYDLFELYVREVDHIRTEVDLRFTDFIKSLGAAKLWEIYNNFSEILKMYFLVLAIHMKGNLLGITFSNEGPLTININKKLFPSHVKKVIENFEDYALALKKCKKKLTKALRMIQLREIERSMRRSQRSNEFSESQESIIMNQDSRENEGSSRSYDDPKQKIDLIKKNIDWIYDNVVNLLQHNNYSPIDMITAIEIIDKNNKIILKTCESIELYQSLLGKFEKETRTVLIEATTPQRKDKMIQQIAQAVHEKIFVPCEIVSYFWPYPDR